MRTITDSYIVEVNPDGSKTVTEISTEYPASTAQKFATAVVLGAIALAPFAPLAYEAALQKAQEKRAARKAAKNQ